jgi:opacity protein-like surface antigen
MIAKLLLAALLPLLTLAAAPAAFAEKEWAVTLLGGQYSGSKLLELGGKVEFKDSYTAGLAVSYEFVDWGRHMRWELEGQMLKHFGEQEHVEFTSSINARWITFPWNRYLDTSVAIGGGLSVTSEVPVLEKRDPENSQAATLLHYLLLEAAVGLPSSSWSLVARVHHRSGIFGLFSHSGSNVLALGLRYRF